MRAGWAVSGVGLGLLLLGLGCGGGTSVPPSAFMAQTCGLRPVNVSVPLIASSLPKRDFEPGALWFIGADVADGRDGAAVIEMAEMLGQTVDVVPSAEATVAELVSALQLLKGQGQVRVIVDAGSVLPAAVLPDAAYADELRQRLGEVKGGMVQAAAAQELHSLLVLCPSGGQVMEAVAVASPEYRCALLGQGMEEALPSCPLTNGDRVLSAMAVALGPAPGAHAQSFVLLRFAEDGVPLALGEGRLAEAVGQLVLLDGQAVRLP